MVGADGFFTGLPSVCRIGSLLMRALTAAVFSFLVVHGSSDNATKKLALDLTVRELGYRPVVDTFA